MEAVKSVLGKQLYTLLYWVSDAEKTVVFWPEETDISSLLISSKKKLFANPLQKISCWNSTTDKSFFVPDERRCCSLQLLSLHTGARWSATMETNESFKNLTIVLCSCCLLSLVSCLSSLISHVPAFWLSCLDSQISWLQGLVSKEQPNSSWKIFTSFCFKIALKRNK